MITPAFWCTILVANHALIRYNVPREIITLSTALYDMEDIDEKDMEQIASPRVSKDGKIMYLSNGIVSWLNCQDVDYIDLRLEWKEEVDLLLGHGLQFGRDMVRVQWYESKLYTMDDYQMLVDCNWVNMLKSYTKRFGGEVGGTPDSSSKALLWVDEKKMFKGYDIRTIKNEY